MMTVEEYASDMNKRISEIMELCKGLDINVTDANDMLSDDDIILLDNEIENNSSNDEELEIIRDGEKRVISQKLLMKGDIFTTDKDHATYLIKSGYAQYYREPREIKDSE